MAQKEYAFFHFGFEDTGGAQIGGQYPLYDRGHIAEIYDANFRSRVLASGKASLIQVFDPGTPGEIGGTEAAAGTFTTLAADRLDVDNIRIDGNAITSTDENGDINLTPNGTGSVVTSAANITGGAVDGTPIGANTPSTGVFTTLGANQLTVQSLNGDALAGHRNLIVNGCHRIWQRGTSITAAGGFTADRHAIARAASGNVTISRQSLDGTEGIDGNPQYALRWDPTALTSGTYYRPTWILGREALFRTAGRRCVFSFWAKASASTSMTPYLVLRYGAGGSADNFPVFASVDLTTAWRRFVVVMDVPSLSGKTLGTDPYLEVFLQRSGSSYAETVDFANVQLEIAASGQTHASPFEHRDEAVELAMCRRYFERVAADASATPVAGGFYESASNFQGELYFAEKRAAPTLSIGAAGDFEVRRQGVTDSVSSLVAAAVSRRAIRLSVTTTGGSAGAAGMLRSNNADAYIDISAE